MRWAAILIVGLAIVASLAWLAGEQHRENCIREGRTACSVLPWDDGQAKAAKKKPPSWVDELSK